MTFPSLESPPVAIGVCARCAHDADFEIGGVWLCVDCYHVAGSTCSGIGTPAQPTDLTC